MIKVVSSLSMKAIAYVEAWRGKYKSLVVETTDFVVDLKNHPMKILYYTTPKQIFQLYSVAIASRMWVPSSVKICNKIKLS